MVLHLLLLKCFMPLAYVHPRDVKIFGRPVAQIGIFKARLFFIHTPPQSVSKCQLSSRDSHTHTISFTDSLPLSSLPHSTVSRDGKVGFGFIWIQVNRRSRLSAFKKYWQQRRRRRRQKTKTKKLLWFSSPSKFFAEAHDDDLLLKDLFSVDTVSEHPFKKRLLPA